MRFITYTLHAKFYISLFYIKKIPAQAHIDIRLRLQRLSIVGIVRLARLGV